MDKFDGELPDIEIRNIGTRRNPLNVVEARIILEAWDGYLYRHMENGREIADKKVTLCFECYNGNNAEDCRTEINAYNYLLKNQRAIRDSILKALSQKVGELTEYLDADDWFVPNVAPNAETDFDFRKFIGPLSISFHEESRDDFAYLDWHFQCVWDEEHGFAVTTHKDRVIDIDQQDTDVWKIYADNGTLAERQKEYAERAKNFKPGKIKPWWQFW